MKISSLIYKLKKMREFNGDVEVFVGTSDFFDDADIVEGVEMRNHRDWEQRWDDPYYCCIIRHRGDE